MHRVRHWREYLLVVGDLLVCNLALWLALSVRHGRVRDLDYFAQHVGGFNILFVIWILVAFTAGLYDLRRIRTIDSQLRGILVGAAANLVIGIAYFYFFYPFSLVGMTPKTHLVLTAVFAHAGMLVWRRLTIGFLRMSQLRTRVAFVGETPYIREVREDLARHPQLGYVPVPLKPGAVDVVVAEAAWLDEHWKEVEPVMGELVDSGVRVMRLRDFYEGVMGKIMVERAVSAAWLLSRVLGRRRGWYPPVKRALDVVGAALGLAVAFPFMAAAAVLIRFFDGPPVLFGQRRVGHLGREFVMWKFRTMAPGAESRDPFPGNKDTGESLITPVGTVLRRLRIDELPQLWNVLVGEMSLVGPRPEWTKEVEALERTIPHYRIRNLLRPGITGWAQLNFRATRDPGDSIEKLRYDLWYLENFSLDIDLTILLRTVRRVVAGDAKVPPARTRVLYLDQADAEHAAHIGALLKRHRN